jgi:hypothetical protein
MDWVYLLNFLSEIAYLLVVFGVLLTFAIVKGRQATINSIVGLYLALLIALHFPWYDSWFAGLDSGHTRAGGKLGLFLFFSLLTTLLCYRIMPDEFKEQRFESLGKKALLAAAGTILVMIFRFHVLPVTAFMTPGTPLQTLFAPEEYFFWWLVAPLIILYLM